MFRPRYPQVRVTLAEGTDRWGVMSVIQDALRQHVGCEAAALYVTEAMMECPTRGSLLRHARRVVDLRQR